MSFLITLFYVFTTIIGIVLGYQLRMTECLHRGYLDSIIIWSLIAIVGLIYTTLTSLCYFMMMLIVGWFVCDSTGKVMELMVEYT